MNISITDLSTGIIDLNKYVNGFDVKKYDVELVVKRKQKMTEDEFIASLGTFEENNRLADEDIENGRVYGEEEGTEIMKKILARAKK